MSFRVKRVAVPALAVLLLHAAVGAAQAVRGSLLGNITDQAGLPMAGVTVTVVEVNTNISSWTMTSDSGAYALILKEGVYRVEAAQQGFKSVVRPDVGIPVNVTVRVDFTMEVSARFESVVVSGSPPILQTDRADTGRTIEGLVIQQLPLAFSRNFQGILVTVPGATRPFRPHSEFFNPQDSLSTLVNGQSRLANNVLIEGVDNNHRTGLLTVLVPSPDAIESVSISTSNYEAEFGRAGGAVTNVTLRSGTNVFKGSVFAFGNTDATMAAGYFSRIKPPTTYLQNGFVIGGPLRRDRLFFFGDYQYTLDRQGRTARAAIPPVAFRNGDFSGASTIVYDPRTGNPDGAGRTPFPGNLIPADRISRIAREILARLPDPNLSAAPGQVNFQTAYVRERVTHAFDVKMNQQISANDQLSERVSFQRPRLIDPPAFGLLGGGGKDFAGKGTNLTYGAGVNYHRVWSPTLVMEARSGLTFYRNRATPAGFGHPTALELGIPGANLDAWSSGMTQIDVAGFTSPMVGFDSSLPWDRSERTVQLTSVFTKSVRNHLVKFGGDARYNRDFLLQPRENGGPRGRFQFRGAQTAASSDSVAQNGFANALASFLLDVPASVGRELKVLDRSGTRHAAVFAFIQDKWLVSPRITVDVGLRHEYYTPLVGLVPAGGLSNYDPETNTLRVAGYGEVDQAVDVRSYYWNFAPRTGVSYRMDENTVLRGGYGASTIPFPDNSYAFNFPVRQSNQLSAPNTFAAAGSMEAGFPAHVVVVIPAEGIIDGVSTSFARNRSSACRPTCTKPGCTRGMWRISASCRVGYRHQAPCRRSC